MEEDAHTPSTAGWKNTDKGAKQRLLRLLFCVLIIFSLYAIEIIANMWYNIVLSIQRSRSYETLEGRKI